MRDKYFPSQSIKEEDARIAEIWVKTDLTVPEVVDKYASEEYKDYYYRTKAEERRLWEEEGIIEE